MSEMPNDIRKTVPAFNALDLMTILIFSGVCMILVDWACREAAEAQVRVICTPSLSPGQTWDPREAEMLVRRRVMRQRNAFWAACAALSILATGVFVATRLTIRST